MKYLLQLLQMSIISLSFFAFSESIVLSAEVLRASETSKSAFANLNHVGSESTKHPKPFSGIELVIFNEINEEEIIFTGESTQTTHTIKTIYTIKKGDTLRKISKKFYGTYKHMLIVKENQIANPDLIYPGETLTIPLARIFFVPKKPVKKPKDDSNMEQIIWVIIITILSFLVGVVVGFILLRKKLSYKYKKLPVKVDPFSTKDSFPRKIDKRILTGKAKEIRLIINTIKEKVEDVEDVIFLSYQGLVMVSTSESRELEEEVAAMAATILGLVRERTIKGVNLGELTNLLITGENKYILLKDIGGVAIMAILTKSQVDWTKVHKNVNQAIDDICLRILEEN